MGTTSNQQGYGNGPWGTPPPNNGYTWYNHPWACPPFWRYHGLPWPVGVVLMVLGFMLWWPIGLAMIFLMGWSGHMGCWGRRQRAMYQDGMYQNGAWQGGNGPFQGWAPWKAWGQPQTAQPQAPQQQTSPASGNHAFDEYRAETLRRLEDEQREFGSFLERLRFAKDKAEFDQFMAERRERPGAPPAPGDQAHP